MFRRQRMGLVPVVLLLLAAGSVQAGWPRSQLGFGRHRSNEPPAPRVIDVAPYAGVPSGIALEGAGPAWSHTASPRAYPWGHFGARSGSHFFGHSNYYREVSHWWE